MTDSPTDFEHVLESKNFVEQISRRLSRDRHSAEDLAQEVWIAALRAPPPPGERRKRWLATVARNLAVGNLRTLGRRAAAEKLYARQDTDPAPLEGLELESVRGAVRMAVERLSEPYRSAIQLHFYDGLDAHGIAAKLGVPVETVRTRIKRGMSRLAEDIERSSKDRHRSWLGGLLGFFLWSRGRFRLRAAAAVATVALLTMALWRFFPPASAPIALAIAAPQTPNNAAPLAGTPARVEHGAALPVASPALPPPVSPTMTLSGAVVGPTGRAVPGAWVRAWSRAPERVDGVLPEAELEVLTDGDGRFRLADLPPDSWVYAEHSALVGEEVLHAVMEAPREVGGLVLRLGNARTIRGQVLDETGRPVWGAAVLLQGSGARATAKRTEGPGITFVRQLAARVEADVRGAFVLPEAIDCVSSLSIRAAGFPSVDRLVGSGETFIDVQLLRGADLVVRVTSPEGHPVPDARVRAFSPAFGLCEAHADGSGLATFAGMPLPALACWSVDAPGWARGLLDWRTHERDAGPLPLSLERPRALRGCVVDARGAPAAEARLTAFAQQLQADPALPYNDNRVATQDFDRLGEARSDASGEFTFASLPRHPLRLEVQGPDAGSSSVVVEVDAQATELLVSLAPPRSELRLRGVLRDALTLATLSNGLVQAFEGLGRMRTVTCRVDRNGRYELLVPQGEHWSLCISAPDHAPRIEALELDRAPERSDFELYPTNALELLVTDAHGRPLSAGALLLHDEHGTPVLADASSQASRSRRTLGSDGRVRLLGLPAAPVIVTFLPAGLRAPQTRRFDLGTPIAGEIAWRLGEFDSSAAEVPLMLELRDATGAGWFAGQATVEIRDRDDRVTHDWTFRADENGCRLDPEFMERTLKLDEKGLPIAYFDRSLVTTEWHTLERTLGPDARFPRFSVRLLPGPYRVRVTTAREAIEQDLDTRKESESSLEIRLLSDGAGKQNAALDSPDR